MTRLVVELLQVTLFQLQQRASFPQENSGDAMSFGWSPKEVLICNRAIRSSSKHPWDRSIALIITITATAGRENLFNPICTPLFLLEINVSNTC
jgi:hypothetical protein